MSPWANGAIKSYISIINSSSDHWINLVCLYNVRIVKYVHYSVFKCLVLSHQHSKSQKYSTIWQKNVKFWHLWSCKPRNSCKFYLNNATNLHLIDYFSADIDNNRVDLLRVAEPWFLVLWPHVTRFGSRSLIGRPSPLSASPRCHRHHQDAMDDYHERQWSPWRRRRVNELMKKSTSSNMEYNRASPPHRVDVRGLALCDLQPAAGKQTPTCSIWNTCHVSKRTLKAALKQNQKIMKHWSWIRCQKKRFLKV